MHEWAESVEAHKRAQVIPDSANYVMFLRAALKYAAEDQGFDVDSLGLAVAVEPAQLRSQSGAVVQPAWWDGYAPGQIEVLVGDEHGPNPFTGRRAAKTDVLFEWFGHDYGSAERRSAEVREEFAEDTP
jgi:hypothetical protein